MLILRYVGITITLIKLIFFPVNRIKYHFEKDKKKMLCLDFDFKGTEGDKYLMQKFSLPSFLKY